MRYYCQPLLHDNNYECHLSYQINSYKIELMGRRPVQNKKPPSDYPQFSFRVSNKDKDELNSLIEEAQANLNDRRETDDPFINKNDVIVQALKDGLKTIKKNWSTRR